MSKPYDLSLVWLRRDLRLKDNTALVESSKLSRRTAVAFIFDKKILEGLKDKSDRRVSFIFQTLEEINNNLIKKGSQLIIKYGDPTEEIPKLIKKLHAEALFFNEDYEVYAKKRDHKVKSILLKSGADVHNFKDHVIFSGNDILKPNSHPYQMFTPYKKTWLKNIKPQDFAEKKTNYTFVDENTASKHSDILSMKKLGFSLVHQQYSFQQPGRKNGKKSLSNFSISLKNYDNHRDYPGLDGGTSGLSTHLRFGTLSIRECVRFCIHSKNKGAQTWLSELIWRDFYSMILDQYPHVEKGCFKKQYDKIKWPRSARFYKSWCEGKTGFPIVDAGMRQLNTTGWMHNRVRMIVASFLVKDLLVDWRKGESYFAEKLLDFDLASNNGGWQWSASTGCDAQPYFRVFNPSLQSKRFDPDAIYIKKWIPELQKCKTKDIHDPENSELHLKSEYPKPIIVHSDQKIQAVRLFKDL